MACTRHADAMSSGPELCLLVLLRHAEAKKSSGSGDLRRELSSAGREHARAVGTWLRSEGVRPDAVISSHATRTLQTWDGLRQGGLHADDVWTDEAVYDADPADIIESIAAVPDDVRTLVVIGHAPGVPALAGLLADHLPQECRGPDQGWPPAAVAVVSHRGTWADFPTDDTAIVAFRVP